MPDKHQYSENPRINLLIENILDELCPFLEEQATEISELTAIGKALGAGKDISALLEMILSIARRFTKADGGTLYLLDSTARNLEFHVIHNASLGICQSGQKIDLPCVPLYDENDQPNLSNVSSHVFHTGEVINIKDVYTTDQFQFDGTKKFDEALSYRSMSMIVVPMKNHQDDIIGILQLINAIDPPSGRTVSFGPDAQEKAAALASQASVILTQQMLIVEMRQLFEAFIRAIAVSIDEKSKHTGGHIQRVTELSMMIAEQLNQNTSGYQLNPDEIDELRIAALMHDTGKITTPEHIIGKSSKLETVFDRIELLRTRWELFKTHARLCAAEQKILLLQTGASQQEIDSLESQCNQEIDLLEKEFSILEQINDHRKMLTPEQAAFLKKLHGRTHQIRECEFFALNDDEYENLSIKQGTLTPEEREIIKEHANLTEKILNKLPWPKNLSKIPFIAGAHHEKLDGTGYPLKLDKSELNIQARILAIADIFEALSAPDRPYKEPMPLSQTERILRKMAEGGELDKEIIDVFFNSKSHLKYAARHLKPAQIDV